MNNIKEKSNLKRASICYISTPRSPAMPKLSGRLPRSRHTQNTSERPGPVLQVNFVQTSPYIPSSE